jgi:hypothetical protein
VKVQVVGCETIDATGLYRKEAEPCGPLVMVGTVHGDTEGFQRILRFLETYRPRLVFVELSPYGHHFRKAHQTALQQALNHDLLTAARLCRVSFREALRHPEIKAIRRQLALPSEYRAASLYCRKAAARLILADYSPLSKKLISYWPELLSVDNLTNLLRLDPLHRPATQRVYDEAAQAICASDPHDSSSTERMASEMETLWQHRERHMARVVGRTLMLRQALCRAVCIGGWQHLRWIPPDRTLRTILKVDIEDCFLLDRGFLQAFSRHPPLRCPSA